MIVTRPPHKQADLFWKFEGALTPGAPVQVAADDCAVAFQHGRALGVYWPGQQTLPAEIPNDVEIWFVLTRLMMGLKFGGNVGQFMTPGGTATARTVFGDLSYKVVRPDRFVIQIANMGMSDAELVTGWLKATIVKSFGPPIARLAKEGRDPALDPGAIFELVDAVKADCKEKIEATSGVKVVDIGNLNIR